MSPDEQDDPLDSTPRDGGSRESDDTSDTGCTAHHRAAQPTPLTGPDGEDSPEAETATPAGMATPQDDDLDPLDGWHVFAAAVDTGDGVERTVVILRCSDLAHADRQTLEQLDALGPWPSIESCGTCSPQIPNEVPAWLTTE